MKFKYIPTLILTAFLLTGCAGTVDKFNSVVGSITSIATPDNFDTVEAAYGSAVAVAVGYRDLCQRKIIDKSCWKVIQILQPYEMKAYNAYSIAKNFVSNNPNSDASALIQNLKSSINLFKSVQLANGVK